MRGILVLSVGAVNGFMAGLSLTIRDDLGPCPVVLSLRPFGRQQDPVRLLRAWDDLASLIHTAASARCLQAGGWGGNRLNGFRLSLSPMITGLKPRCE